MSERSPLRADHGTSALIRAGAGPTWFLLKTEVTPKRSQECMLRIYKQN